MIDNRTQSEKIEAVRIAAKELIDNLTDLHAECVLDDKTEYFNIIHEMFTRFCKSYINLEKNKITESEFIRRIGFAYDYLYNAVIHPYGEPEVQDKYLVSFVDAMHEGISEMMENC